MPDDGGQPSGTPAGTPAGTPGTAPGGNAPPLKEPAQVQAPVAYVTGNTGFFKYVHQTGFPCVLDPTVWKTGS